MDPPPAATDPPRPGRAVDPVPLVTDGPWPTAAPQARYRRLMTFGDLLDESVRLYRTHFVTFAVVSAIVLLPSGVLFAGLNAAGLLSSSFSPADFQNGGRFATNPAAMLAPLQQQLSLTFGAALVSSLFTLLWTAAIVLMVDAYIRGVTPALGGVFGRALLRLPAIVLASIVLLFALVLLGALSTVLFVLTGVGLVGGLIATVALLVWWLRPTARRGWLKWLIILTTPFGLVTYFAFRWAMAVAAIVLERRGPLRGIGRSSQLVSGQWFRVSTVLTIAPLIVGVLVSAISTLVSIPLGITAVSRGQFGADPTLGAVSIGVNTLLQILFGSVAGIAYALLFQDLRNRREGTDLLERLQQLESTPAVARG